MNSRKKENHEHMNLRVFISHVTWQWFYSKARTMAVLVGTKLKRNLISIVSTSNRQGITYHRLV